MTAADDVDGEEGIDAEADEVNPDDEMNDKVDDDDVTDDNNSRVTVGERSSGDHEVDNDEMSGKGDNIWKRDDSDDTESVNPRLIRFIEVVKILNVSIRVVFGKGFLGQSFRQTQSANIWFFLCPQVAAISSQTSKAIVEHRDNDIHALCLHLQLS